MFHTNIGYWFDGVFRGANRVKPLSPESVRYAIDVTRAKLHLAISQDDEILIVYNHCQLKLLLGLQRQMSSA